MTIGSGQFVVLSAVLFALGLGGTLARRDGLGVIMSLEVMFTAIAVALVGFTRAGSNPAQPRAGLTLALVVAAVAAAQGTIGIGALLLTHRRFGRYTFDDGPHDGHGV